MARRTICVESPEHQREGRRERGEEEEVEGVVRTYEATAEESWEQSVELSEEKREVMMLSTVPAQGTLCRKEKTRTCTLLSF